jgi:hypothetical protein
MGERTASIVSRHGSSAGEALEKDPVQKLSVRTVCTIAGPMMMNDFTDLSATSTDATRLPLEDKMKVVRAR